MYACYSCSFIVYVNLKVLVMCGYISLVATAVFCFSLFICVLFVMRLFNIIPQYLVSVTSLIDMLLCLIICRLLFIRCVFAILSARTFALPLCTNYSISQVKRRDMKSYIILTIFNYLFSRLLIF